MIPECLVRKLLQALLQGCRQGEGAGEEEEEGEVGVVEEQVRMTARLQQVKWERVWLLRYLV